MGDNAMAAVENAKRWMVAGALAVIVAPVARSLGATLLNDSFTDGERSNGADAADGDWWQLQGATLTVSSAAPNFGTGNALVGTVGSNSVNRIGVMFASTQLSSVGASLSVSFDYMTTATTSQTFAPAFGFYNSNGTSIGSDADNAKTLDDVGYYSSTGVNGANAGSLYWENTVDNHAEPDTNGPVSGTDNRAGEGGSTSSFNLGLSQNDIGHYSLTLTRVDHLVAGSSVAAIHAVLSAENVTDAPGTVHTLDGYFYDNGANAAFYDTFDTLYVRSRANNYKLDNVVITSAVPEPGTLGLLGVTGLMMLRRRRRGAKSEL
jgi:hypothetical protein